jgi:hypothetical protein
MRPMPPSVVFDGQRVRQGPDADAAAGQVVDEVEDLAEVAADPVERVHYDRVAGPGVAGQLPQARPLEAAAGLLVGVDPLIGDALRAQGVELAGERLPGGRDSGVAEVKAALRTSGAGRPRTRRRRHQRRRAAPRCTAV